MNGSQLHGLKSSCNPSIRRTIYDVNGITSSVTSADFNFYLRFDPFVYSLHFFTEMIRKSTVFTEEGGGLIIGSAEYYTIAMITQYPWNVRLEAPEIKPAGA